MCHKKEITGLKYGHLTVLSVDEKVTKIYQENTGRTEQVYKCQCDCEQAPIVYKTYSQITNTHVPSCGCEYGLYVGAKFGRLTLLGLDLEKTLSTGLKTNYYICECSCENKTVKSINGKSLIRSNKPTTSCGCLAKETSKINYQKMRAKNNTPAKKEPNEYELFDDHAEIIVKNGLRVLIDLEDFEKVHQYYWYPDSGGYIYAIVESHKKIILHKFIMGDKKKYDHINRNILDNRKTNLRETNASTNSMNRSKTSKTKKTSIYKGVSKNPRGTQTTWIAYIRKDYKGYYLGSYHTEIEAARAYDTKALELFGEFAAINFPEEHPEANPVSALNKTEGD